MVTRHLATMCDTLNHWPHPLPADPAAPPSKELFPIQSLWSLPQYLLRSMGCEQKCQCGAFEPRFFCTLCICGSGFTQWCTSCSQLVPAQENPLLHFQQFTGQLLNKTKHSWKLNYINWKINILKGTQNSQMPGYFTTFYYCKCYCMCFWSKMYTSITHTYEDTSKLPS